MPSVVAGNKNNGGGLVRLVVRSFALSSYLLLSHPFAIPPLLFSFHEQSLTTTPPTASSALPALSPHPISFALDLEMTFHLPTLLPCVWGYNPAIHPAMRFHPSEEETLLHHRPQPHQHQQYNMTTDGHSMSSSSTRGQKNTTRSTSSSSSAAASRTEEQ